MTRPTSDIEREVEMLLAAEEHSSNPLREPLASLLAHLRGEQRKMTRITQIADRYQNATREAGLSLADRLGKQVRQIERIMRVSDRYQQMMRDLNKALEEASTHDLLTGLANRRHLTERMKLETTRRVRPPRPFSLAMVDIDRFKAVNDRHGHDAGDLVLVQVANTLRVSMRAADLCGRWGGEEFMILMPDTLIEEAFQVADRTRQHIEQKPVLTEGEVISISASFGVAQRLPGEALDDTIKRADEALYRAKQNGRNRVEQAT